MLIYALLIALVIILIISYLLTKDVFSPPCMICESYTFAVFCAILNIKKWGIDLSQKTVFLILIGIGTFVFSFFIFMALYKLGNQNKSNGFDNIEESKAEYIVFNKSVCAMLIIIQLFFVLAYLYFFFKSMGGFSISNFSNMMTKYRKEISFEDTLQIPIVLKQLHKFFKGFMFVYTFIEIHNFVLSKCLDYLYLVYYYSLFNRFCLQEDQNWLFTLFLH